MAAAGLRKAQAREFHGQNHPAIQQLTQSPVVAYLVLHHSQILLPHEMTAAVSLPGETQLIVRTMLAGRIGLAAAIRFAADVVLLR